MTSHVTGCIFTNCRHFLLSKNPNIQHGLQGIAKATYKSAPRTCVMSQQWPVQYSTKSKCHPLSSVYVNGPDSQLGTNYHGTSRCLSPPTLAIGTSLQRDLIIRNYKSSSGKQTTDGPLLSGNEPIEYTDKKASMWHRVKSKLGISNLRISKSTLKRSGSKMYLILLYMINYPQMLEELKLPDTYMSFFYIIELHLWLLMMRLLREGEEGKVVRNACIESMWQDLDRRVRSEVDSVSVRKEGFHNFQQHFWTSLAAYDEGYLSDDPVLAGALWRTMYMTDVDPQVLELLVCYVRKQVKHLETLDSGALLYEGFFSLLPLHGDEVDEKKVDLILRKVYSMKV